MDERHEPTYLVLSGTPLVTAVVFALGLAYKRSGVNLDWGSVGEWVGGLATAAAVVVALAVAISDSRRRDEERKDVQAAQARLVTVETHPDMMGGVLFVKVTNHSASPVFALIIEAVHATPDPVRACFTGKREWPRLDSNASEQAGCFIFEMDGITPAKVEPPRIVSADVSFVDSAGLRWRRWNNTPPRGGTPIRHRKPPAPVDEVPDSKDD